MPPLYEGSLLYMPTTMPGISVTEAQDLMQTMDKILKTFPEVASVHGKAGRADTATDPAPLSMMETIITLKPKSEWRKNLTKDDLIAEMDKALKFPGVVNAWTMPMKIESICFRQEFERLWELKYLARLKSSRASAQKSNQL